MGKYSLHIYPAARRDLKEIVDYVNESLPQAALDLYDSITEGIASLIDFPMRCPALKTPELYAKGYRALFIKKYVVFFVIREDTVQIRRILYGKRKFEQLS